MWKKIEIVLKGKQRKMKDWSNKQSIAVAVVPTDRNGVSKDGTDQKGNETNSLHLVVQTV